MVQNWIKKGFIYKPDGSLSWSQSHAQIPVPMKIDEKRLRIYFATRNKEGLSQPAFIEVDINNPSKILYVHKERLWNFGQAGTFDDSGIMPASYFEKDGHIYMYYVGWNKQVTTAYHLAAGIAVSKDGGITFEKFSEGPVLDRHLDDPIFRTIPCVHKNGNEFKMWYISSTGWLNIEGKMEPLYLVKYGESKDGVEWKTQKDPCIHYKFEGEAIGRPWVVKNKDFYEMWYSSRGSLDYRKKDGEHYKIGYARSEDGKKWQRLDEQVGIECSAEGWDSEMICYCSVYEHNGKRYMLYNGNGFGREGFGYAIEKE